MASNVTLTTKLSVPVKAAEPQASAHVDAGQAPKSTEQAALVADVVVMVDTFGLAPQAPPETAARLTGTPINPLASSLPSNLEAVEAAQLPEVLQYDLAVQLPALMGSAVLGRDVKAARLMEFMVPYAERLATLGKSTPLEADQRKALAEQMLKPMMTAGLKHVTELTTGKSGLDLARTMLAAEQPEDVHGSIDGLRFDSTDPSSLVGTAGAAPAAKAEPPPPPLSQQPVIAGATTQRSSDEAAEDEQDEEESRKRSKGSGGPLWGLLHKARSNLGRIDDDEKWVPDEKGLYAAGLVALIVSFAIAAMLTLFR